MTAELPWPCSVLQRNRTFLPKAPKEETPAVPRRKSTGAEQGCPAPDRHLTARLTPLPNLPMELHLQKHLTCRKSQLLWLSAGTTSAGVLKNQSSITSPCLSVAHLRVWLSLLGTITESWWSPWMRFTAIQS